MDAEDKPERVFRVEGWVVSALIAVIGIVGNYTMSNIRDDIHDIIAEMKVQQNEIASLDTKTAVLTDNFNTLQYRIDRYENATDAKRHKSN